MQKITCFFPLRRVRTGASVPSIVPEEITDLAQKIKNLILQVAVDLTSVLQR